MNETVADFICLHNKSWTCLVKIELQLFKCNNRFCIDNLNIVNELDAENNYFFKL